jgi:autotransporter strand-loop-strand O-heptosyltransferase
MARFNEDIFVIDSWPDNESKERDLINLINRLKIYEIPILLTGHYPINSDIQKMVDYYLYDKSNPLLTIDEFQDFGVNSVRWTDMGSFRVENHREYHHDYAIWETMRNSFNFCKFLGKKYIHFLEYDNLPHPIQYRQTFLERIRDADVVLYEYNKGSISEENPYCSTYIFSIKTDVAVNVIDQIKTKDDFFRNKPDKWQLEKNFLNSIIKVRGMIFICKYIPNYHELNTQAVWNRDGMYRNGTNLQIYLAIDDMGDLYLHTISEKEQLIEVVYKDYIKFHSLLKNRYQTFNMGKYQQGERVVIYYQGIEILSENLEKTMEEFRILNKIVKKTNIIEEPPKININFVDGPFVEILGNQNKLYHIQFINQKTNLTEFELDLRTNHWAKCSKKYYIDWLIKIKGINNDFYLEKLMDLKDKRVLISIESKSIGDTLSWFHQCELFRIKHKCAIICSTFHNNLFKDQYSEIEFVPPGTTVNNINALYRVGVFFKNGDIDYSKHPSDPKKEPLIKIASDILGLDYVEARPLLPILTTKKKKQVSIGTISTAQCKFWNRPNGWEEVVNYLKERGYDVLLLSSEEDGYMGNKNPGGVIKINPTTLGKVANIIQESELFIGISSGLSWLSWATGTPTIIISGFTDDYIEPQEGIIRIINKKVCHGCWGKYNFNPGDWQWCPVHKGTDREFECTKEISSEEVIYNINLLLEL